MREIRGTRRQRGVAQDFANQLAQMAVGYQAMFVGAALKVEPEVGVIELDAATASASINGHPTDLALARYLNGWVIAELKRKSLEPSWLKSATVRIQYSQTARNSGESDWADFTAAARVVSDFGETTATFTNKQHLVRGWISAALRPNWMTVGERLRIVGRSFISKLL